MKYTRWHMQWRSRLICVTAALLFLVPFAHGQKDELEEGDRIMAMSGGYPSTAAQYIARCPPGRQVAGFDLQADGKPKPRYIWSTKLVNGELTSIYVQDPSDKGVLAIQPICAPALAPAVAGAFEVHPSSFGVTGLRALRLVCPSDSPVVIRMTVEYLEFAWLPTPVNGIGLTCGLAATTQSRSVPGPEYWAPFESYQKGVRANSTCAEGLVAVGIVGRANTRLDAVGLICGRPKVTAQNVVKIGDRVKLPPTGDPPRPICEVAREARARNSPAAPGLEAQCRAAGEAPAVDVDALAARGEAIANEDPLAVELRNQQPDDSGRRGFDIGMAATEGQTAPGPVKDRIRNSLATPAQGGFNTAVSFSLERNRNAKWAATGAAIADGDPGVAEVRNTETDVFYRLGFDIASGIFGDPALGAQGNTATGPGSLGIRDSLSAAGQRGFNASAKFHLSRDHRP